MKFYLILLFLTLSKDLFANENTLKKILLANNKTITITGHPAYSPVVWATKDGKALQGIGVELMQLIFKELDVTVQFKNVDTWGRAQEEVKNGRIDILIPPYKTSEREVFFDYTSVPFMNDDTAIFVKKGKEFTYKRFEDLKKHNGVAIINDSFGSLFDEYSKSHLNILRLSKTELCFNFVYKERADFVIAGLNSGNAALIKLHLENKFTVLPKKIITTGLYVALSKKSKWNNSELILFLNKKIKEYKDNGTIKSLEQKYNNRLRQEARFKQ